MTKASARSLALGFNVEEFSCNYLAVYGDRLEVPEFVGS